jgi:hypothetical protein
MLKKTRAAKAKTAGKSSTGRKRKPAAAAAADAKPAKPAKKSPAAAKKTPSKRG